ncbi:hypothetical protein FRC10_010677 [Ceratobasidium sp. 414]|nr:hypothetical protein FRC10_010677 [Ceratobasidium sp. 414]
MDDGDRICTASAVGTDPDFRDNSFVRYALLPDTNAAFRNRLDVPVRQTNYGQVLDIFYIEFLEDPENNIRRPYLLACVQGCETGGLDAALPENPLVMYCKLTSPYIIHIDTIEAVIGRIKVDHNTWAIIDWSWSGARTQFVDEDEEDLD